MKILEMKEMTKEFKEYLLKLQVISSETLTGCGEFEDLVMDLMDKLNLNIDELAEEIKKEIK